MPKNYFFDMDGTLYRFDIDTFRGSSLQKSIQENILVFLKKLGEQNTVEKYHDIETKYGENFSVAFEEIYHIPKEEFFTVVWDLEPNEHLHVSEDLVYIFEQLSQKGYHLYILSDAPKIWIEKVLDFLQITPYIQSIYSGQGDARKSNGKLYQRINIEILGQNIMIGDQEVSDIIQAKNNGFGTMYISYIGKTSQYADKNITNLSELL